MKCSVAGVGNQPFHTITRLSALVLARVILEKMTTYDRRLNLFKENTHVQCLNLVSLFLSTQAGMFLRANGVRKSSHHNRCISRKCAYMWPVDDLHAYAHTLEEQQCLDLQLELPECCQWWLVEETSRENPANIFNGKDLRSLYSSSPAT